MMAGGISSNWTVMDTYPHEAWQRLGRALERRRGELGYGFRQRGRFTRERGGGRISIKTISRLEKGERASYPQATLGAAETIYRWAPGSIEAVLRGGDPHQLAVIPAASRRNPLATDHAPATPGERLASWVYVRMRELGRAEDDIHQFLADEGLPREPTTLSAVRRIVAATGASVAEVLALLGIDDMTGPRAPQVVKNYFDDGDNGGTEAGEGVIVGATALTAQPAEGHAG
jgi:hypothetical protein